MEDKYGDQTLCKVENRLREGYTIVVGTMYRLTVDWDSTDSEELLSRILDNVGFLGFEYFDLWHSTNGNYHAVIHLLSPIESVVERVAWQLVLGSDSRREALALKEHRVSRYACILFRPPNAEVTRHFVDGRLEVLLMDPYDEDYRLL